jgi:hypothetical protein
MDEMVQYEPNVTKGQANKMHDILNSKFAGLAWQQLVFA